VAVVPYSNHTQQADLILRTVAWQPTTQIGEVVVDVEEGTITKAVEYSIPFRSGTSV